MDKAKNAVKDFVAKSGQHDTTVHEKVAPAVVHENIQKQKHEEVTTAIDREVHQDHYHTTVQPVHDRQVLPEEHHNRVIPVEHREHDHGKHAVQELKQGLEQERAQFQSTRSEAAAKESHSTNASVVGEHVHHHVHETIQPVVNKETIQPSVVHTTVPVHEVHHNAAEHHAATALPAVSLADFKQQGGTLSGREEKYDGFRGEPTAFSSTSTPGNQHNITAKPETTATTHGTHGTHGTTGGLGNDHSSTITDLKKKTDPRIDSDNDGSRTIGNDPVGTGRTGTGPTTHGTSSTAPTGGYGSTSSTSGPTGGYGSTSGPTATQHNHPSDPLHGGNATTTEKKKPSLLDRLNPRKDADHDGKKGFND